MTAPKIKGCPACTHEHPIYLPPNAGRGDRWRYESCNCGCQRRAGGSGARGRHRRRRRMRVRAHGPDPSKPPRSPHRLVAPCVERGAPARGGPARTRDRRHGALGRGRPVPLRHPEPRGHPLPRVSGAVRRVYMRVTITSPTVDRKARRRLQWSLVLEQRGARAAARAWRRRGYRVELAPVGAL